MNWPLTANMVGILDEGANPSTSTINTLDVECAYGGCVESTGVEKFARG